MKRFPQKGFTVIELLVVIAIIGILSSVVLAAVNHAREKGDNTAVKTNLSQIRSQAEIVYDQNNQSYLNVCTDPNVSNAITSAMIDGADTGTILTRCNSIGNAWAVNVLLRVPENSGAAVYWCVDSLGASKGEINELAGATQCL